MRVITFFIGLCGELYFPLEMNDAAHILIFKQTVMGLLDRKNRRGERESLQSGFRDVSRTETF